MTLLFKFLIALALKIQLSKCQENAQEGPAVAVLCDNPYALCAYANCTVNDDNATASCGCYAFDFGTSVSRVELIPDPVVQQKTREVCNSTFACWSDNVDDAPVCAAVKYKGLWASADIVSTYSSKLEEENGVEPLENGTYVYSWECPATPGRFVPVCMMAPCVFLDEPTTNPYNYGTINATCTCPLVEVTEDYRVFGGLQSPCSSEPTKPGDYVQAAGGALLDRLANDEELARAAWQAVDAQFVPSNATTSALDNSVTTPGSSSSSTRMGYYYSGFLVVLMLFSVHYCL